MCGGTALRIETFDYPASSMPLPMQWEGLAEVGAASSCTNSNSGLAGPDTSSVELPTAAEEATRSFEAGREQGILEGRDAEVLAQQKLLREAEEQGAKQAALLADQFAFERDRFLQTVEHEVVKLALAIAARILRREAQTDPLFLVGAVRVALGQLAATLKVRLRVPSTDADLWVETLNHLPNLKIKPSVVPDESMQVGDCIIETEMGSVDLSLPAQLFQLKSTLCDEGPAREEGPAKERETPPEVDRLDVQL